MAERLSVDSATPPPPRDRTYRRTPADGVRIRIRIRVGVRVRVRASGSKPGQFRPTYKVDESWALATRGPVLGGGLQVLLGPECAGGMMGLLRVEVRMSIFLPLESFDCPVLVNLTCQVQPRGLLEQE